MMKKLAWVPLLLAVLSPLALAGNGLQRAGLSGGGTSVNATNVNAVLTTQAATTYYVRTTGNDGNPCTLASPCLTIPVTLGKVPKRLRHPITIDVGAGTFGGAYIEGFTVEAAASTGAYLDIRGTMAAVTPASGAASGAATAVSAQSGITWATLTKTAAGWTVDDFKGKFLAITSGADSGDVRAISGNSATVITIAGGWTLATPSAADTFEVRSISTVFDDTSMKSQPVTSALLSAANSSTSQGHAAAFQVNGASRSVGASVAFHNLKLTGNGTLVRTFSSDSVLVQNCRFESAGYNLVMDGGGGLVVDGSTGTGTTASRFIQQADNGNSVEVTAPIARIGVTGNVIYSPWGRGIGMDNLNLDWSGNYFQSSGSALRFNGAPLLNLVNSRFDGANGGDYLIRPSLLAVGNLQINNCDFANQFVVLLNISPVFFGRSTGGMTSSGGISRCLSLSGGAHFQINATDTCTGSVSDVSVGSSEYTYANVRAGVPTVISDQYGTTVFQ